MRKNYSTDSEYHSQRNNAIVPYASCNTTAMVMALKQAGWSMPLFDPEHPQPEDDLSAFLRTDEAKRKQQEIAPWSVGAYPPQEVHACLEWGVNAWLGGTADAFTMRATHDELIAALVGGGGVVLSGRFPLSNGELGHIVSLAGYYSEGELDHDDGWIIDDPYGIWHTDYRDPHGNDISVSDYDFNKIFCKARGYWAHMITAWR
jgi:hypothetical protein